MENKDSKYCGCLFYSANALARTITKMAEEEFKIVGLAPSYAFLLMTVNDKPGIQPKEISQIMMLTPSTITRLIEKMEFKDYLNKEQDGKFTKVYPTEKSKKLNNKIHQAWENLFSNYSNILGNKNAVKLTSDIYQAAKKIAD
ncbi:MAG: MarR family transcriptional regulator [Ignavibacteriaceae bacterium]